MATNRKPSNKRRSGIFVFLVPHRTESRFQIGQCRPDNAGVLPMLPEVDSTRLVSLRFTDPAVASRAEAVLRSLTVGSRVISSDETVGYWVGAEVLETLLAHIVPGLATWFDVELTLPQAHQPRVEEVSDGAGAVSDGTEAEVRPAALAVALQELKWVSPGRNIGDCAEYLSWALTTLAERCSVIIAEGVDTRPEKLFFEVGPDFEREVLAICADLGALFVCARDPAEDGADVPPGARPFGRLVRGQFSTTLGAINGWMLPLEPAERYFDEMLVGLRPRIAGWDKEVASLLPRAGADVSTWPRAAGATPLSEQLWRAGESPLVDVVDSYFTTVGVALTWKPYGLRFIARSPLAEDNGAPLLLARLYTAAGEQVGVQRIRLDTRQRKLLMTSAVDNAVCIRLWRPKPRVMLATVLEDALALNQLTRAPAVVAPGRAQLARYGLEDGVDRYDVCLPSEPGTDWLEAAHSFRDRAAEQGVEVHIYRLSRPTDVEGEHFWWKVLLDAHAAGIDGHAQFERHRLPECTSAG